MTNATLDPTGPPSPTFSASALQRQFVGCSVPSVARPSLADQLQAEWVRLARRAATIRQVRSWGLPGTFADLDELLGLTGLGARDRCDARHNDMLARLVARAATDELAARIVMQRILPGLHGEAARRCRAVGPAPWFDEIVATAWIVIRRYRVTTRGERIAMNLVRDAAYQAFTAPRRRRWWAEANVDPTAAVTPFSDLAAPADECALVELHDLIAQARRRGLADAELDEIRDLLGAESSEALAARRGVTARAVRYQRVRIGQRLRSLVAA